jgi:hypothetical protein
LFAISEVKTSFAVRSVRLIAVPPFGPDGKGYRVVWFTAISADADHANAQRARNDCKCVAYENTATQHRGPRERPVYSKAVARRFWKSGLAAILDVVCHPTTGDDFACDPGARLT